MIFKKLQTIDAILSGPVVPTKCAELLELARSDSEVYKYAFTSIQSPEWFPLLYEKQAFELREDFSFQWPAQYLIKVAEVYPEPVMEIILQTDSDDHWLYRLFTEVAMNLPPELAEVWADRLIQMINDNVFDTNYFTVGKLPEFTIYLAKSKSDRSVSLASAVMEILPKPDDMKSSDKYLSRMPRYGYQEYLRKVIPVLGEYNVKETAGILANKLTKIIEKLVNDIAFFDDHSSHWRPAIEDHTQNHDFYIESSIIEAIRVLIEHSCEHDPLELAGWLEWISEQGYPVYNRLAMHLIRKYDSGNSNLLEEWLLNDLYFSASLYLHEYSLLLEAGFSKLEAADQEIILNRINDIELKPSYSDPDLYKKFQQHRKLWFIRDSLPESWLGRFAELDKQFHPDNPEKMSFSSWTETQWGGEESPIHTAELVALPVPDIVEYLTSDIKYDEWAGITPSAIASKLNEALIESPEKFVQERALLTNTTLHPAYIRGITTSFTAIYKSSKTMSWEQLCEWCLWVMDQQSWEGKNSEGTYTVSYGESKEHILRFISELLSSKAILPFPYRWKESVFGVIRMAFNDADPSPERGTDSDMDYHSIAINSVRGVAMETALDYALWISRLDTKDEPRSFSNTPEVRELLENRLNTENELSPAVRSCFGNYLPQIWWMDSEWLAENLTTIFPMEDELAAFYQAPWLTYLLYGKCYKDPYDVIKPLYERVVTSDGIKEYEKDRNSHDPIDHFATHLALYYSWEKVSLDEDDLLCQFMLNAHSHYRAEVLKYMGRVLEKNDGLPPLIAGRFKKFFDWWLEKIADKQPEEWQTFWWWFACPHYEADWQFENLNRALEVTTFEHCDGFAFEKLNTYMEERPEQTLSTLDTYIDKVRPQDAWVLETEDSVASILEIGHLHPEQAIREQADNILNKLGSRGFLQYREIWEKPFPAETPPAS